MEHSEKIDELGASLSKAQGADRRMEEASIIKKILNKKFGSNQNVIKSALIRFIEKISYGSSDCWYWIGSKNKHGYGVTSISNENKAHRLSWKLFKGKIPEGLSVLHRCDVRCCVNPDHLFLGTQNDNMKDCAQKGRIKSPILSGETNPMSKLNNDQVRSIREMSQIIPQAQIAKHFGVSNMTISRIVRGESWKTI